jgi:PAS domain S-box-containing protein
MATHESSRQTQLRWLKRSAVPPRAARQVLQSTLQRVNVPSFIGDTDGRIQWLNDAAKDAFGDRAGDLYTTVVAPEYVERVAAEINRMRSGATSGDYEIDVILRDGRRRRVEVSSVPIEGNAVFHGVFGVVLRPGARPSAPAESPLTPRQQQVLELLANGQSTKQIAASLHLSRETIRNYVRDLLRALGAHSRIEALAEARRRGLT